jgi:glycine oxidase
VKITVVGAGIVGCAIAHELASRGVRVRLIDARGVGRGTTRASAGILAPHIEGHIPALRNLAASSLALYDDFIRRVEHDSRRPIEYRRNGTLQVALDGTEASALSADAHALSSAGVQCTLLDGDAARRLEPALSDRTKSGLLVPLHGHVAATPLTDALADAARARGVRLSVAAVMGIDSGAAHARVTTEHETIDSDGVIVATGSWPVPSRATDAPRVKPIRGQLVQLRSQSAVASRVLWGQACYIVPWSDGTVLVGATVEDVGFDERPTAEGVRGLLSAACNLAPSLDGAHFEEVRVGLRPKTDDELPIIGRSETEARLFYALGHYRNGVLLAPLTAALMADLIVDGRERPELAFVRPGRLTRPDAPISCA